MLEMWITVSGPIDSIQALLDAYGPLATEVKNAGGFYYGNTVKMIKARDQDAIDHMLIKTRGTAFSAHRTVWSFETSGYTLELFQRADTRKDPTIKPWSSIMDGLEAAGLKDCLVVRTSGSGYEVIAPSEDMDRWVRFAALVDLSGIAVKYRGKFLQTKEKKEEQKQRWMQKVREKFGATGLHRSLYDFEVDAILARLDLNAPGLRTYPVYGLQAPIVVLEGLSEEQREVLCKTKITTCFGKQVLFGFVERILSCPPEATTKEPDAKEAGGSTAQTPKLTAEHLSQPQRNQPADLSREEELDEDGKKRSRESSSLSPIPVPTKTRKATSDGGEGSY